MSGTEGLILCGLEKKTMEYLVAHPDDRFLTSNRLSLALGSNELLVLNALKALTKTHLVSERVDSSMSMTTYRAYERPSDSVAIQTPKVVTPRPTVTEKRLPEPTTVSVSRTDNTKGKENDNSKGYSYDRLAEEKSPTIEELRAMFQEGHRFVCKICEAVYDHQAGLSAHMVVKHDIKVEMDIVYAELDKKIKEMYPAKGATEIGRELGFTRGIIGSRITRMHKTGEITEYWIRSKTVKCAVCGQDFSNATSMNIHKTKMHPEARDAERINRGNLEPPQIQIGIAENTVGSFNIGQLLKVNSENQVAVVNATLEVIDERGSEYEVTLKRTNRGLGLILSSQMLAQLIDTLKYRVEEINDISEDAERDDPDWFQDLMEEQYLCESIIEKIRKDAKMPEGKVE